MPRANRYILPNAICHLTHRCHNRSFLFKFACDRSEYRSRLRKAAGESAICVLTYNITCNQIHLVIRAAGTESVSAFMQRLEGEFAEYYNLRKQRKGAFWSGRYWCTMLDTGQYVRSCMKYVDLNMVRAGVVSHPSEWGWGGYRELMGERQRYRIVDLDQVLELWECKSVGSFREHYRFVVEEAIRNRLIQREPCWTESIAVGSEAFVKEVGAKTDNRRELYYTEPLPGGWAVHESKSSYS